MEFKKTRIVFFIGLLSAFVNSCTPTSPNTNGAGGTIPTRYISILDNSISPNSLTVSIGSSITFVNQSGNNQTLVSDNCNALSSPTIAPSKFYVFKKDTIGTITYHSVEFPTLRGQITFRP